MLRMTTHSATARNGPSLLLAGACFAAGLGLGTAALPGRAVRNDPVPVSSVLRGVQPAQVLRVVDGDTFEARVRIWPGMDVTTLVRLRGVDAPELRARCAEERSKALAARDALARLLQEGAVEVARVAQDKYGGRVDADVSTAQTPDVAQALIAAGVARRYDGGKRGTWCG
jgi:endonuclease YncB( thermonuclease family)